MRWLQNALGWLGSIVVALALVSLVLLSLPFVILGGAVDLIRKAGLRHGAPKKWRGKRILLVYSDSPNWKEYIESRWLPRHGDALVTLNWSRRAVWARENRFEQAVFRHWAGEREFNPIVIAFPRQGPVRVIRFWQPFRDYKHGRETSLRQAESELESLVQELARHAG
jgi:hypothetical protein